MNNLQKWGGIASLTSGLAYIVGFTMVFTLLAPFYATLEGTNDPLQLVKYFSDHEVLITVWNAIIYVVAGVALVVLVQALHERLKDSSPSLMQTATLFGVIWAGIVIAVGMLIINDISTIVDVYAEDPAQAASLWVTLDTIEQGLGGSVELPGGLWILLLSMAALRSGEFPKSLNYLGLILGLSGIVTVAPALEIFGAVFGLGFIVWFIWAGILMVRTEEKPYHLKASI